MPPLVALSGVQRLTLRIQPHSNVMLVPSALVANLESIHLMAPLIDDENDNDDRGLLQHVLNCVPYNTAQLTELHVHDVQPYHSMIDSLFTYRHGFANAAAHIQTLVIDRFEFDHHVVQALLCALATTPSPTALLALRIDEFVLNPYTGTTARVELHGQQVAIKDWCVGTVVSQLATNTCVWWHGKSRP